MTKSPEVGLVVDQYLRSKVEEGELLDWAVSQFVSFVGANFAGLSIDDVSLDSFVSLGGSVSVQLKEYALTALSFGVNAPFSAVRFAFAPLCPEFSLFLGRLKSFGLRRGRFLICCLLMEATERTILSLDRHFLHRSAPNERRVEYALEKVFHHLRYFEGSVAKNVLDEASALAGIEKMEFSGALGRRTRFQQKEVPQLFLEVRLSSEHSPDDGAQLTPNELPQNCESGDDTLLERIVFSDANGRTERKKLSPNQCACVLATALLERQLNASADDLSAQLAMAYVEEVISQESCWAVQVRALFERCSLEQQNVRRVERACAQLESLSNVLDTSNPTPFWTVIKSHAKVLLSLGCTSNALRIFERLQLWEEAVECFQSLRQPEKAEALVRKLLERGEKPSHLCLLGDVTDDAECYRKAIWISDDKSFRARFSLAEHLLRRKRYAETIEHYSRAVQIQPLRLLAWFNLGFAAMNCQDFRAFHRCVDIDPAYFEAWNNLAASYIHLGLKHRAHKILLEALKLNWENVRVLDNLLLISVEIGDHKQAVLALEKLLELGKGPIDELPLEVLASTFLSSERPPNSKSDDVTLHSLLAIFSRVNSRQSLSPKLVRIYAHLKRPTVEQSEDIAAWSTHAQLLERAFQREYCHEAVFCSDQKICVKMLTDLMELVNALKNTWRTQKIGQEQICSKLRLRIRPTIGLLERHFGPNCENSDDPDLRNHFRIRLLPLFPFKNVYCTYYRGSNEITCGTVTCETHSPLTPDNSELDGIDTKLPRGWYRIGTLSIRHDRAWFNLYRIPERNCIGQFGLHAGENIAGSVAVKDKRCFDRLVVQIERKSTTEKFDVLQCRKCVFNSCWLGSRTLHDQRTYLTNLRSY
uniref:TPR_REGION domain-containing protein n=1 Tax=Globodera pallida TaxID=36090 RepID=A0A183CLI7_GLOPA